MDTDHDRDEFEEFVFGQAVDQVEDRPDWTIVTFGLHMRPLGRREGSVSPVSFNAVKNCILWMWQEYEPRQLCLHWVRPQPDWTAPRVVTFIVEVCDPVIADRYRVAAALMILDDAQADDQIVRAAWVPEDENMLDIVEYLDLDDHCTEWGLRACTVKIAGRTRNWDEAVHVAEGSLIQVTLGDVPTFVPRDSQWVRFLSEFLVAHHRQVDRNQWFTQPIVIHIHCIGPDNVPLGMREMVLSYRQIVSGEWRTLIHALYPWWRIIDFGYVYGSPPVNQDEWTHWIYHFILNFAPPQHGMPVLVTQRIIGPWRPPTGFCFRDVGFVCASTS